MRVGQWAISGDVAPVFHGETSLPGWTSGRLHRASLTSTPKSKSAQTRSLVITGNGDVIEPEQGLIAIGSGGPFAQASARALLENTDLKANEIVEKGLDIAADICIYTNQNHTFEEIE